jgi:hypothetical protein
LNFQHGTTRHETIRRLRDPGRDPEPTHGRTYNILTSTTLNPDSWFALTGGIVSDNDNERSVTDQAATTARKFYRIEITKP